MASKVALILLVLQDLIRLNRDILLKDTLHKDTLQWANLLKDFKVSPLKDILLWVNLIKVIKDNLLTTTHRWGNLTKDILVKQQPS